MFFPLQIHSLIGIIFQMSFSVNTTFHEIVYSGFSDCSFHKNISGFSDHNKDKNIYPHYIMNNFGINSFVKIHGEHTTPVICYVG